MDLIGRTQELACLERWIEQGEPGVLTVTGQPGIGKTSLALAAAACASSPLHDSVAIVDLAPLTNAGLVLPAIASTLGIPDSGDLSIRHKLTSHLNSRRMLLVLDNFEHLQPAAEDIAWLRDACGGLRLLVTSRTPLRLAAEHVMTVQPLAPAESHALFLHRAQQARPDFTASATNAEAIASICARLDGIPLAIELAAARIRVLSATQVADRLDEHFSLLADPNADRPARHRTLRLALDWSVRLLDTPARVLLGHMAVFAGGATLEAIAHVCDDRAGSSLQQLVEQSLLTVSLAHGGARYRLLEPVRQYALELLQASGQQDHVGRKHAAFFLDLAEHAAPELFGSEQILWLDRLDRDLANLREAVAWFTAHGAAEQAQRLAAALWKFCEVRGRASEGDAWLRRALELDTSDSVARSKALHGASALAFVRGEYARAAALDGENLALRRRLGDRRGVGMTLLHLGIVYRSWGDIPHSVELCRESLAIFRELDDSQGCANALNQLGMGLLDLSAYAPARQAMEEALSLYRRLGGVRRLAMAFGNLGDLARAERDYARADSQLLQSLELFAELDDPWGTSAALESMAKVALEQGLAERATVLFGAAEGQRDEAGAALATTDVPAHEQAVRTLQLALGPEAVAAHLARGRAMGRAEVVAFARAETNGEAALQLLTVREREVAAMVARGASNDEVAEQLVITRRTAETHVANIMRKLGLGSRAQLAVWWIARLR